MTDLIFEKLIKSYGSTPPPLMTTKVSVDYFEANTLRYMAGYVVQSLRKKITSHPLCEQLLLCLSDLQEDIGENILILNVNYELLN